jgi:putative hemolysin
MGVVLMLLLGILLSAFFSGSETGFYRAARVRLALDAMSGDPMARVILWLTNNPAVFVATTLIGNNLANYVVSLAIVLSTAAVVAEESIWVELLAPVVFAPLVFIYGELLPKNLFYHAPNKLLRWGGPFFLIFTILFAPVSAILWALARFLQRILGDSPEQVRLRLARRELQRVLDEGQEAGVLEPAQRRLAQNLFAVANRPVEELCTPVARAASVRVKTPKVEVLRLARRHGAAIVPVMGERGRKLIGYVQVMDLRLSDAEVAERVRPLLDIRTHETHLAALIRLRAARESVAGVVNVQGETIGLIYADQLLEPLLRFE